MFTEIKEHRKHYGARLKYFSTTEFVLVFLGLYLFRLSFDLVLGDDTFFADMSNFDILMFAMFSAHIYSICKELEARSVSN